MKAEGTIKQEHILEVAIRRFSHFGVQKTTLADIADDLAISKPSLFYYFPDKNSLVAAVAEKITNEFLQGYKNSIDQSRTVEEALLNLIDVKRQYFKKYFLLAIQGNDAEISRLSSDIQGMYSQARQKAISLIADVLKKGMEAETLTNADPLKTSRLIVETLSAFEFCMREKRSVPEMKDIDDLFDKQKEVLTMIVNGLKN
jgi:TetR/AcrR family transcriptional regulator